MRANSVWGRVLGAIAACTVSTSVSAETITVGPGDDVEGAINGAQPGDVIELESGMYALTDRFGISVRGTAEAPIIVRGDADDRPIFHREGADQNVIDVDDAEHLVLHGLEISGGSHGVRLVSARFVTVEACDIHDTGDVALSANSGGSYEGLRILRNHIHHTNNTGEGMYLGCNDNACQMFDSLIEGNYVHHTNGPTVEQGDGIEIKEGSYNNVVRDNVIHDTNYPCILTYSTVGNGAPNVIERNLLWNCGDHGIQSAADAVIRNNIILSANVNGIQMQPHQAGAPSNLVVVHNTVLKADNYAIAAAEVVGSVVIANNAIYTEAGQAIRASGELSEIVVEGNVGRYDTDPPTITALIPGSIATDLVDASFSGMPPNDVFPRPGSALIGAGVSAHTVEVDFNGTPRGDSVDVGAYVFDAAGNPGWPLGAGPKDDRAPALDAGTPDAGNPSGGAGGAGGNAGSSASGGVSGAAGGGGASAGTGAGASAGSISDPNDGGVAESTGDDSGCSCSVIARSSRGRSTWLALIALLLLTRRVRRRLRVFEPIGHRLARAARRGGAPHALTASIEFRARRGDERA